MGKRDEVLAVVFSEQRRRQQKLSAPIRIIHAISECRYFWLWLLPYISHTLKSIYTLAGNLCQASLRNQSQSSSLGPPALQRQC
jgi:hypothetical protein